jgi:ferredoxin
MLNKILETHICMDVPKSPGAITVNEQVMTDPAACILCCACVKSCPEEARVMEAPEITRIDQWLYKNYHTRKDPEIFL